MAPPRRARLAAVAALLALAAACTRPGPPAPAADPARLLALDLWEARGRIAVRRDGERPEGGQAGIVWRQSGPVTAVSLRGPFGTGGYAIESGPAGLTLRTAAGDDVRTEPDPAAAERWLRATVGWSLPIASTRYWLLGLADPALPAAVETDADGRILRLRQAGWQLDYVEYRAAGGLWLPRRVTLTDTGQPGGVRVKIAIDRWLLDTAG